MGSTTGRFSALSEAVGAPSSTVIAPVAWITRAAPASSVPVNSVAPDETVLASTQHGAEAFTVTE